MKRKVLASLLVIAVVAGLVGFGTMAYFSDVETSEDNTFTSGSLDLVLSDDDEFNEDGVTATWESPLNWAPGDVVNATLTLKNVGNQGSRWVAIDPMNLVEGEGATPESEIPGVTDLGNHIFVTNFTFAKTGDGGWSTGNIADWIATWGCWGTEAPMTLAEFVDDIWSFMAWDGPGDYDDPRPGTLLLPSGTNTVTVEMTLQFDPAADNEYQGDTASFDLRVVTFNGPPSVYYEMSPPGSGHGYGRLQ